MKSTDKRYFGDIVLVDLIFSDGEWSKLESTEDKDWYYFKMWDIQRKFDKNTRRYSILDPKTGIWLYCEGDFVWKAIMDLYCKKEELKQSTPKIEKMKIQKLWWETMLTRDMTIEKINEIIDYINNKD